MPGKEKTDLFIKLEQYRTSVLALGMFMYKCSGEEGERGEGV